MTTVSPVSVAMLLPLISGTTTNAIVQVLISLGGAGLVVQLLLLRQNRRRIGGEASANEANAASTLSGAAMRMVENAQLKEREAEARADALQARLELLRRETDGRRTSDGQSLENRAWEIHYLKLRVAVLEDLLRHKGVTVPPDATPKLGTATRPELSPDPVDMPSDPVDKPVDDAP